MSSFILEERDLENVKKRQVGALREEVGYSLEDNYIGFSVDNERGLILSPFSRTLIYHTFKLMKRNQAITDFLLKRMISYTFYPHNYTFLHFIALMGKGELLDRAL